MGKLIYLNKLISGGEIMTIFDVANYFLSFKSLTPKQLQKLCYYAQAWYYTVNDEPLFDYEFQAWVHGPVNPELYREYRQYGRSYIQRKQVPDIVLKDKYVYNFLSDIFKQYGDFTGDQLELLTHNEDPWRMTRGDLKPWEPSYDVITLDSMKEYYSKLD